MNTLLTLLLCALLTGNSNGLRCFDCNPESEEPCVSPDKNKTNVTTCPEIVQTTDLSAMTMTRMINEISNNSSAIPRCYYLHFSIGNLPETGVYRGCVRSDSHVEQFCQALNNQTSQSDGQVKYCHFCTTDECNGPKFDNERAEGFVANNNKDKTGKTLLDVPTNVNKKSEGSGSGSTVSLLLVSSVISWSIVLFDNY